MENNKLKDLETRAQEAHNWTSFSPQKRGTQMIEDYGTELGEDVEALKKEKIDPLIIEGYVSRYRKFFISYLSAKSNCFSTMITGPANVNVRKHTKANRSEQRHYEIFREWRIKAKKAIIRKATKPITPVDEIDKYKALLEKMQKSHLLMKEGNIRIKNAKKTGEDLTQYLIETFNISHHMIDFTIRRGFGLTNNNANIKRIEQRIVVLEKKEEKRNNESEVQNSYNFNGGAVVMDYEIDRIQIFFTSRPTVTELIELKKKGLSGFNWSPSNNCWQRKITNNAIWATKQLIKEWYI